jgi:hypothetical protein
MDMPAIEKLSVDVNEPAQEPIVPCSEPSVAERTTLYPKIKKLTDFIYAAKGLRPHPSIHLTGSVKLHGTHADIVFVDNTDEIRLQSRNQLALGVKDDNYGFAAFFAATNKMKILALRDRILERYHKLNPDIKVTGDVVIAGEWGGTGVQKKVALATIPKFFAIISININDAWVPDWEYGDICDEDARFFHISKGGFFTQELHFNNVTQTEETIRKLTDAVEDECPFAKALGVSGRGEGIVWKATNHCSDPEFWFKSKGDLLAVSQSDKLPASAVAMENRERVDNFAKAIVTENRLEQGWEYLSKKEAAGMGEFLKWILNDCLVEEKMKMEELKISKGKLSPAIAAITKPWFWARLEQAGREASER